jgi:Tfp pilus assembly protein PilX
MLSSLLAHIHLGKKFFNLTKLSKCNSTKLINVTTKESFMLNKKRRSLSGQKGYLLVVAMLLIVFIGFLGVAVVSFFNSGSTATTSNSQADKALYLAESGIEHANRLVPAFTVTTLSGAITNAVTIIPVVANGTTNFPTSGRIKIDQESINYTGKTTNSFTGATRGVNSSAVLHVIASAVLPAPSGCANSAVGLTDQALGSGTFSVSNSMTILSGAISAAVTTLPVDSAAGFPTSGTLLIDNELVTYTGKTATSFTGVTRGTNTTTAAIHTDKSEVALAPAGTLSGAITASVTSIPVGSTASYASSGRILIDSELIDYIQTTATSFLGATRGVGLTRAASHASGAPIGQRQCNITSVGGIPTASNPSYARTLNEGIQLPDAWAVGVITGGVYQLSHFNQPTEGVWTSITSANGTATTLNSVGMTSYGDAWAAGDGVGNRTFIIARKFGNNATWARFTTPTARCNSPALNNLSGVSVVSSQEAWAVGVSSRINGGTSCNGGNYRYTILRFDGSNWAILTSATSPSIPNDANQATNDTTLEGVSVIDTTGNGLGNTGLAVGLNGKVLRYNGSNWAAVTVPGAVSGDDFYATYLVSASEGWVVGGTTTGADDILKWNGSTLTVISNTIVRSLRAIKMRDDVGNGTATSGYAVGLGGVVYRYDGSTWTQKTNTPGATDLTSVIMFSADDVWAAGVTSNVIYHSSDGANTWQSFGSGMTTAINGMANVAPPTPPYSSWQEPFN